MSQPAAQPAAAAAQAAQQPAKPPHPGLVRLMALRDELVRKQSNGLYNNAAAREWAAMPRNYRMALLLIAGCGIDVDDLDVLAGRGWQEIPPPERDALRAEVRQARQVFAKTIALSARV